jgi:hypothetical protein
MTDTWNDIRRLADELQLKIHLAGMEARDRWQKLQPQIAEIEKTILRGSDRAEQVIGKEMSALGATLRKLRDDIAAKS